MELTQLIIEGKECLFNSYSTSANRRGGSLMEPVEIKIGDNSLSFITLFQFIDSTKVQGGTLSFPQEIKIGANNFLISSVNFYFNSNRVSHVTIVNESPAFVGDRVYTFVKSRYSDEIHFHPCGNIMNGRLKDGTLINLADNIIETSFIGFYENNKISGLIPAGPVDLLFNNCKYKVKGNEDQLNCCYTISLSPCQQIEGLTTFYGEEINLKEDKIWS